MLTSKNILQSICVPFSVGFSKLSASLTSKFKSKTWCPDWLALKSFFSLSDSRSFALLANTGFFTNSLSLALSLLFAAWSRSVWPVFLLYPKFRVRIQSTLNLSHDFVVLPETKCFPLHSDFAPLCWLSQYGRPRFEISRNDRMVEVIKLFIIWHQQAKGCFASL